MKVFSFIDLDIPDVCDFIEQTGLSFICHENMEVVSSDIDFQILLNRFPEIDYQEIY